MKNNKHYGTGCYEMTDKEGKKYKLTVEQDEISESPRGDYNLATIYCWHRNYNIGDDKPRGYSASDALTELCEKYTSMTEDEIDDASNNTLILALQQSEKIVIIPISCYEHSGITISTNVSSYPYNDRWDAGIIGFAFIEKEKVFKESGGIPLKDENGDYIRIEYKHDNGLSTYNIQVEPITDANWKKAALNIINGEVETLDQYLRNEVYWYKLEEKIHVHNEKKCPHCDEIIEVEDYEEWEEIDSCGGFYGDCLEENGIFNSMNLVFVD